MQIDLFSIPIFIGNIDCSKINLNNVKFENTWHSKTLSSHNFDNTLDEDSTHYLLSKISKMLFSNISAPHKIYLKSIWENRYSNDFQEKHIHTESHFSFVIYKKIKESKTVFFSGFHNLINAFYNTAFLNKTNFFKTEFNPECTENQIIVFPSFLEHMVQKTNDGITISGNIIIEIQSDK